MESIRYLEKEKIRIDKHERFIINISRSLITFCLVYLRTIFVVVGPTLQEAS